MKLLKTDEEAKRRWFACVLSAIYESAATAADLYDDAQPVSSNFRRKTRREFAAFDLRVSLIAFGPLNSTDRMGAGGGKCES
jgi:hypothetical protein